MQAPMREPGSGGALALKTFRGGGYVLLAFLGDSVHFMAHGERRAPSFPIVSGCNKLTRQATNLTS